MWQLHHRMPAWKLRACIDALQVRPIDLAALAEAKDDSSTSGTTAAAPSRDDEQKEKDMSDLQKEKSETTENSAEKKNPSDQPTDICAAAQESKTKDTDTAERQQGATASRDGSMPKKECDSAQDQSKNWVTRFVYSAPLLSWKLRMLLLAFVGWRLGRISFTFFFVRLAFSFPFPSVLLPPPSSCCSKLGFGSLPFPLPIDSGLSLQALSHKLSKLDSLSTYLASKLSRSPKLLSLSRLSNTRFLMLPFKPFTTAISLMRSGSCSPESC